VHTPEDDTRERDDLFFEITVENVEDNRNRRPWGTIEVVIRHSHLSEYISIGPWNLSGSLGGVLEAVEAHLPVLLRCLEAGVPEARSATLSPPGDGRPIHRERVAKPNVVRDRTKRR
jgi:hypothetical protein